MFTPFRNHCSRIKPRRSCLGGDFGGFPDDQDCRKTLSFPRRPRPLAAHAAAATSLTSSLFISTQVKSCKSFRPLFFGQSADIGPTHQRLWLIADCTCGPGFGGRAASLGPRKVTNKNPFPYCRRPARSSGPRRARFSRGGVTIRHCSLGGSALPFLAVVAMPGFSDLPIAGSPDLFAVLRVSVVDVSYRRTRSPSSPSCSVTCLG